MNGSITRKEFLQQIMSLFFGAVGVSSLLSGCQSDDKTDSGGAKQTSVPESAAEESDPCGDLSSLTEQDLTIRTNFNYVAATSQTDKLCDNCQFWLAGETDGTCGGCQLIKGPINPKGFCDQWIKKTL